MTGIKTYKCPSCNAPLPQGSQECKYCGAWIDVPKEDIKKLSVRDLESGDFGIKGTVSLLVILIGTAVLYFVGWIFENTEYWLNNNAVAIWGFGMPLWICVFAVLWRAHRGVWFWGLLIL